jgi:hypothetical protein
MLANKRFLKSSAKPEATSESSSIASAPSLSASVICGDRTIADSTSVKSAIPSSHCCSENSVQPLPESNIRLLKIVSSLMSGTAVSIHYDSVTNDALVFRKVETISAVPEPLSSCALLLLARLMRPKTGFASLSGRSYFSDDVGGSKGALARIRS